MQAYQQKTEEFFVSEEKKFGRINSSRLKVPIFPYFSHKKIFFKIIFSSSQEKTRNDFYSKKKNFV